MSHIEGVGLKPRLPLGSFSYFHMTPFKRSAWVVHRRVPRSALALTTVMSADTK